MDNSSDDEQYQRKPTPKEKEKETSSDLESEHNQDNSHIGDGRSTPSGLATPRTPHTILIESEPSSSDEIDSNPQASPREDETNPVQRAVEEYLEEQRAEVREEAQALTARLNNLLDRDVWQGTDFRAAVTTITDTNTFLGKVSSGAKDVAKAIASVEKESKKTPVPKAQAPSYTMRVVSSTAMYALTFCLGKWLTGLTGIGLLLNGQAGQAALSALVNALVVPLTQALLGDPMGASLRNFGANVPSEDSRQYAAFMTAHALHVRTRISDVSLEGVDPVLEMDRVINEVVWREQGKPGTPTEKPTWFASGIDPVIDPKAPKDAVNAALKATPYTSAQRLRVTASMLARILVADEFPVHTFTVLNGVTGAYNNLWPILFGTSEKGLVYSRVVDAAAHTAAGALAMYFMFLIQDILRPIVQGAGPVDPSDEQYQALRQAPFGLTIQSASNTADQLKDMSEVLEKLNSKLKDAQSTLGTSSHERLLIANLRDGVKRLRRLCRDIRGDFKAEMHLAEKESKLFESISSRAARGVMDTWRVFSGKTSKSVGQSWTDGSPSMVRAASKYLGYVTALVPSTVMSIQVARGIGASYQQSKQAIADHLNASLAKQGLLAPATQAQAIYKGTASAHPSPVPAVQASDIVLQPGQIAEAHAPHVPATAFTAMVAIVGWNLRNVAFDPLYQHVIHAGIGLVERARNSDANGAGPSAPTSSGPSAPAGAAPDSESSKKSQKRAKAMSEVTEVLRALQALGVDVDELKSPSDVPDAQGGDSSSESSETRCVSESESESGSAEKDKD